MREEKKLTAIDVNKALFEYYEPKNRFISLNTYVFDHEYGETDFLVINTKGYVYDIEVKVSRADFKADFKKVRKHQILKEGGLFAKYNSSYFCNVTQSNIRHVKGDFIKYKFRPNKFFYAVPEDLIKVNEVPEYAGLLYITSAGNIIKAKEAPFLHKDFVSEAVERILIKKFYWRYITTVKKDLDL